MSDVKFIVSTCKERRHFYDYIKENVPDAILNEDDFKDSGKFSSTAYFNYQRSLEIAGDSPVVLLEDDVIFCDNFVEKIQSVISQHKDIPIQFFSMRGKDLTIGTRLENGSNFMMNQCHYMPKGMAKNVLEFSKYYYEKTTDKFAPYDSMFAEFMKINKIKYLIWCPNLVNHRETVSIIDKRRSSKRQSKTFKK
jgi:GR25 family glycosyltransferase involved in LPS biosynthesis